MIKINPDILVYKDLEKNNNREWFENKSQDTRL